MDFCRHLTFAFMTQKFPGTCFVCQFPLNFFDYNKVLIFKKKDVEHILENTIRATFLLHKSMFLHT